MPTMDSETRHAMRKSACPGCNGRRLRFDGWDFLRRVSMFCTDCGWWVLLEVAYKHGLKLERNSPEKQEG